MINKNLILPIIFARGGSKGIKNKNLKQFAGKKLIYFSIKFFQQLGFEKCYVSTDSQKIINYAKELNCSTISRPKHLASDSSNELLSWKHAIRYLNKNYNYKYILSLPCTSPIRSLATIKKGLNLMQNDNPDMVVSITKSNKSPDFNMMEKNKNGLLKIYNSKNTIHRRQDANVIYTLNTNFYLAKVDYVLKTSNLLDGQILGVDTPKYESIDIDDIFDFEMAELIYEKKYNRI